MSGSASVPESEEILVRGAALCALPRQGVGPGQAKVRQVPIGPFPTTLGRSIIFWNSVVAAPP